MNAIQFLDFWWDSCKSGKCLFGDFFTASTTGFITICHHHLGDMFCLKVFQASNKQTNPSVASKGFCFRNLRGGGELEKWFPLKKWPNEKMEKSSWAPSCCGMRILFWGAACPMWVFYTKERHFKGWVDRTGTAYTARFAPEKLMVGRFPSLSFWGSACGFLGRINDPSMYRESCWNSFSSPAGSLNIQYWNFPVAWVEKKGIFQKKTTRLAVKNRHFLTARVTTCWLVGLSKAR